MLCSCMQYGHGLCNPLAVLLTARSLQMHALRAVGDGPGVTLSCTKEQEARCWSHIEPNPEAGKPPRSTQIESAELFITIRKKTPVHIIVGSRNDFT